MTPEEFKRLQDHARRAQEAADRHEAMRREVTQWLNRIIDWGDSKAAPKHEPEVLQARGEK